MASCASLSYSGARQTRPRGQADVSYHVRIFQRATHAATRTAKATAAAREKWFLALIVTLAVAQLIAFWMLCSHQVQQAQAREAGVEVRTATAPKALHRDAVLAADEKGASLDASGVRATPVNFSLH